MLASQGLAGLCLFNRAGYNPPYPCSLKGSAGVEGLTDPPRQPMEAWLAGVAQGFQSRS
jgi:hypothetical protein